MTGRGFGKADGRTGIPSGRWAYAISPAILPGGDRRTAMAAEAVQNWTANPVDSVTSFSSRVPEGVLS